MPGSSNFLQWDPSQSNMETDVQYAADSQRAGGAVNPSTFDATLANKLFYQCTTMIYALSQMLVNAGATVSDSSAATLVSTLQTYLALLNSPAFTGTPTAPTPSPGDNSTKLATTAFLHAAIAAFLTGAGSLGDPGYIELAIPSVGTIIFQWGGATTTTGAGDVVAYSVAFPNACLGRLAVEAHASGSGWGASKATVYGTDDGSTPKTSFKLYGSEITSSGPAEQGGLACFWIAWGY